jgi:hypothetical protein
MSTSPHDTASTPLWDRIHQSFLRQGMMQQLGAREVVYLVAGGIGVDVGRGLGGFDVGAGAEEKAAGLVRRGAIGSGENGGVGLRGEGERHGLPSLAQRRAR